MSNPGGSTLMDVDLSGTKARGKWVFWTCYFALVATSTAFITRINLVGTWGDLLNISKEQQGQLLGAGVWPFAISIILFGFIVDKIGYKAALFFALLAHIVYGVTVISAPMFLAPAGSSPEAIAAGRKTAYWMLYAGSVFLGLSNGTVEAVINPVVASMFNQQKVKWLNILHSGWPAGLVGGGLLAIALGSQDWRWTIAVIFIPALIYGFMLISAKFPVNERVAAGASYMGMVKEFGILAAIIVVPLIVRQVIGEVLHLGINTQLIVSAVIVVVFGAIVRSPGRIMLFVLMLIMMPLATTEIGTDGWIGSLMEKPLEQLHMHRAWVLVYTSFIMMVLRAYAAGPIAHKLNPLGLLALSAAIAAAGLYLLSISVGWAIFGAATLYALGKTFFWPTMLGVVSEQCPKGGALTLNAVGGMGMLAVGVLGFPFIGQLQDHVATRELRESRPAIAQVVTVEKEGMYGKHNALDSDKVGTLSKEEKAEVDKITEKSQHHALSVMAIFPCVMLVGYLLLFAYFKSKGGYKPVQLLAEDAKPGGP